MKHVQIFYYNIFYHDIFYCDIFYYNIFYYDIAYSIEYCEQQVKAMHITKKFPLSLYTKRTLQNMMKIFRKKIFGRNLKKSFLVHRTMKYYFTFFIASKQYDDDVLRVVYHSYIANTHIIIYMCV